MNHSMLSWKIKITLPLTLLLFTLTTVFFVVSSYPQEPLIPYQELASESNLIVLARVNSVNLQKGIFGWAGDQPYYVTYQYVTLDIERNIKGIPRFIPLIIRGFMGFSHYPQFTQDEKVVVMLKWFENETHGNYYALVGSGKGKFSVVESGGKFEVTNKLLMGEEWGMDLDNFLTDIGNIQ